MKCIDDDDDYDDHRLKQTRLKKERYLIKQDNTI